METSVTVRTTPMPPARAAPEPEAVAQIQLVTPHGTPESRPVITPATVPPPALPVPVEPGVTRSGTRSIQVHIGTVEVRATASLLPPAPPPAPTPQGFDDYVLLRNYVSWER